MANADSKVPSSLDDLLQFISSTVTARFETTRSPTDGAFLADVIRHQYSNFSYRDFGLEKLSDAIALAESKGLLVRNRAVKHLEVLPPSAKLSVAASVATASRRFLHVRPDVWRSFAYVSGPGVLWYYDRQSGSVLHSTDIAAGDDSQRYVPIHPIPIEEQRKWMTDFVRSRPELDVGNSPIEDAHCFTTFPQWLARISLGLDREWRQFRLQRVTDHIREWCANNALSADGFFDEPKPKPFPSGKASSKPANEAAIRAAILAAVSQLPTDQLAEICIHIVRYLQAR